MAQPPFLRLPPELHQGIAENLELQDRILLSLTCHYFSRLIKPPSFEEFLAAETEQWAMSRKLYACKGCRKFRPLREFADDMRKSKYSRHGKEAHSRFCVKCGIDRAWYSSGTKFTIMGDAYVIQGVCSTGRGMASGDGPPTQPRLRAVRMEMVEKNNYDGRYECEDDWSYSTQAWAEGKHSEKIYEFWPPI